MKVKDPRYDYHITVSVHILIKNNKDEVLMAKRPDTWEWAPGRWGIPGGKLYEHETFIEALKRKTKQELGYELLPDGLYQLKQLIIKEKQAHMYFFSIYYSNQEINGEMIEYKWLSIDDIKKMKPQEFSEYFFKDMLTKYLSRKADLLPMSKIESLDYINLENSKEYKQWFDGIINKNYDPNVIHDYKKWQEKHNKKKGGE